MQRGQEKGPHVHWLPCLIEGTWRGWKNLFSILEQNKLLTLMPKIIPPIVMERSDSVQQKSAKVLKWFNVEFQSDKVDSITEALDKVHVSINDRDDVADRIKVKLLNFTCTFIIKVIQ